MSISPLQAQNPLSAIGWLSDNLSRAASVPPPVALSNEAPISTGLIPQVITVRPLDGPSSDGVGLLPTSVTGLPKDLWGPESTDRILHRLTTTTPRLVPATQQLFLTLLLAELDPPLDTSPQARLLLGRIDKLIELGAVDPAYALLDRAGAGTQDSFQRWFDLSLLNGTEDRACKDLNQSPGLHPDLSVKIFCLARGGDWMAAALTLQSAEALGQVTENARLLNRFLDPDLDEDARPLTPGPQLSPFQFRLYEAIGEPLPTPSLPTAYANADLRRSAGWKAQIEAAERLARHGVLPHNRLLGLYTERLPAASGGVWERVAALQDFDDAMTSGRSAAISAALPPVWQEMQNAKLETVFAQLYGDRLARHDLTEPAATIAFHLALLTPNYETAAQTRPRITEFDRFLAGIAQGTPTPAPTLSEKAAAISDGFTITAAPAAYRQAIADRALGGVILDAIALMEQGAGGELRSLTTSLALLRSIGLEDVARQAALQVLILDRAE